MQQLKENYYVRGVKIKMVNKNCNHPERDIKIISFWRKNYSHGKKSGRKKYSVRMAKEVCTRCSREINRWKPAPRLS